MCHGRSTYLNTAHLCACGRGLSSRHSTGSTRLAQRVRKKKHSAACFNSRAVTFNCLTHRNKHCLHRNDSSLITDMMAGVVGTLVM
jgi:hypothetical protein